GIRDLYVTGVQTCALPILFGGAGGVARCVRAAEDAVDAERAAGGARGGAGVVAELRWGAGGTAHRPSASSSRRRYGRWPWTFTRSEERRVGKEGRCWVVMS